MQLSIPTRLAFALAGAGLAIAGTVFLVRAAWGALALSLGPVWASAITGAGLAALGAILVAVARASRRKVAPPPPQAAMLGAFLEGLRAGRATGVRGH